MKGRIYTTAQAIKTLGVLWATGMKPGTPTGWLSLDQHFTVAPGQLTIVTGWPGSGKSEWVDALMVNLAQRAGWRFAVYSPENRPFKVHMAKLLEKWTGKPFPAGPTPRMTEQERDAAAGEMGPHFGFIDDAEEESMSAMDVLDAAETFLAGGSGERGVVIDPWNELEHMRPATLTETEYVSQTLSAIKRWAQQAEAHVFVVAHPAKQRREEGKLPIPRPDMIAGSQHWWNKADNCITVWRDYDAQTQDVEIHVQKVRFKHIGRIGSATLKYDRVTGRYFEPLRGIDSSGREVVYSYARSA